MTEAAPPAVSVVMPVRDGGRYLAPALQSILTQQGVSFELIVVDDGSVDGSSVVLAALSDPRLQIIRREGDGLVAALNTGIAAARARYIMRMDQDDIALPGRMASQARVLDAHPDLALIYTSVHVIDGEGRRVGRIDAEPLDVAARRAALLGLTTSAPIIHPTVMMRRDMLDILGGYRSSPSAEDHDLWLRALDRFGFHALPEPLLEYRHHDGGISRTRVVEQSLSALMNMVNYRIADARGVDLYADMPALYSALRAWGKGSLSPELGRIGEAQRIRTALKQRQWRVGLTGLARFAPRHAWLLPRSRMRRLQRDLQARLYARGLALLDARTGTEIDGRAAD